VTPAAAADTNRLAQWFCLHAQPRHEHIAAAHLEQFAGVEVFLPRIRFQRATRQGKVWVTEALFPGYLFACFDWQKSLRAVHHATGVRRVVHFGDRWPTLDPAQIAELRQALGTDQPLVVPLQLAPGDEVKIITGAFRGLTAIVSRVLSSRERVAVLMDFLGRQTTIVVPHAAIIKPGSERTLLR
jgi:transcriptional antiterminator RfaH